MYCDYLGNERTAFNRRKGQRVVDRPVRTTTIGKWLRLASQLEKVDLNTYRYQEAHIYCEPVDEALGSDVQHFASIATPLTRFVFVCNALEEAYRFISPTYENMYELALSTPERPEYQRSPSMQAAYLLDARRDTFPLPPDHEHLVDNLLKIASQYAAASATTLDFGDKTQTDLSFGLNIVRNLRNHIAHGVFPILDNPEYSMGSATSEKRNLVNLLYQLSRIAGLGIQMILACDNDGFASSEYSYVCNDEQYGEFFRDSCNLRYLLSLHREQNFGLNESDYFRLSTSHGE